MPPLNDPDQWRQRVGALTAIPRLLAEHGADPAAVLNAAGLPTDALSSADGFIPYMAAAKLITETVKATGCEHFGLVIGREWRLRDLGLLGRLVQTSPTVRDALQTYVAFHQLNSQGAAAYLLESGVHVEFGYVAFQPRVDELAPLLDGVMAIGTEFVRELAGGAFAAIEVRLARSAPRDVAPHQAYFGCPIRFDAGETLLRFDRSVMGRRLATADAAVHDQLKGTALGAMGDEFVPRVYRALRLQMLHGAPSGDTVAQQLNLQRRTFNRRLESYGLTFQQALDDVRYEVGQQLLRETELSVAEVACALGYEESANFSRAFRRWSGLYPGAWRKDAHASRKQAS